MGELLQKQAFETRKRHNERKSQIEEKHNEIPERYNGDIKRYLAFCVETDQEDGIEAMLDYLFVSLTVHKVKKTTWERRLAAIRKHLSVTQGIDFRAEPGVARELSGMRKKFLEEQFVDQTKLKGKSAGDKQEILNMLGALPVREKAITLVNLITANRPSEMVRLKVKDFDLEGRSVDVYLKKQKKHYSKRLTQEVVKAVRDYIKAYNLKGDDYFIGRFNYRKRGIYESVEISEIAYTKALQKWTGLTAYNFRKTQVVSMHEAGADLSTIAKQTGHKSLETLSKHYLSVSDSTVDKYL